MRVLWFSINSACYQSKILTGYNGGGWIASLEKIVKEQTDIELGIAFEYNSMKFKDVIDGVTYYPLNVCSDRWNRLKKEFTISHEEKLLIPACLKVVEDFKPDLIQCFGSEWSFGLITQHVSIPVIIHMQGSMPSYHNVLYPPRYTFSKRIMYNICCLNWKNLIRSLFSERKSRQRTERELRILKLNRFFLGRTDWDYSITRLLSQNSHYFVCNEALRDSFIDSEILWCPKTRKEIILCTTGSGSLWKGLDVVLKTADILSHQTDIKFVWKIIGGKENRKYIEWVEHLSFKNSNVVFTGILNDRELKEELLNCDIYVHPAYIDNSPNALCEAMILGVPCIASYVGGIPSIIENLVSGILVPANEPYYLAEKIVQLSKNTNKQKTLSREARERALSRHNRENIKKELLSIYQKVQTIR